MSGNIKLFWFLMGLTLFFFSSNLSAQTYDYFMNGQAIQDIDFNNSRLLVGTEGGIALIDRSNNEVLEVFSKLDGLPTYDVTAVALQNSNQWYAATNPNGLSYYDNGNLTSINDPNSILSNFPVTDLYLSNSGVLWIATQGGGILNTQDRVNFNYFNTNNSNLGSNQASSFVSHNNQLYVFAGGIQRWTGIDWVTEYQTSDPVIDFDLDNQGRFWLAIGVTFSNGAPQGGGVKLVDGTNSQNISGIGSAFTTAIEVRNNGEVWVGNDQYLWTNDGNDLNNWTQITDGFNREIVTIAFDESTDEVIVGQLNSDFPARDDGNLTIYLNGQTTSFIPSNSPLQNDITAMEIDHEGTMWMVSRRHLYQYKNGVWDFWRIIGDNQPAIDPITDLDIDSQGNVWMTSFGGLFRFNPNTEGLDFYSSDGLLFAIGISPQDVPWVATSLGDVLFFNGTDFITVIDPVFSDGSGIEIHFDNQGLPFVTTTSSNYSIENNQRVNLPPIPEPISNGLWQSSFIDVEGNIWIGRSSGSFPATEGNLLKLDVNNVWTLYDQDDCTTLGSGANDIRVDGSGNIWMTHGDEFSIFDETDCMIFDSSNSPLADEKIEELEIDQNGNTWIEMASGILVVNNQLETDCPDQIADFISLGTFEDHKYFLSNNKATWLNAKANAESVGGYLTSINSQDENDFLKNQINDIVFIGLSDSNNEGVFEWANDEPVSYLNIDGGNSTDKDYATMNFWAGTWNFDNILVQRKYILEIPCGTNPCTDNDNDGVCSDQDCDDNDATVPNTPGTSCDDGDATTENDVILSDGCTCEGTSIEEGCNVSVTSNSNTITISGMNGTENTKVFTSDYSIVWSCDPWNGSPCTNLENITGLDVGETYFVSINSDECSEWIPILIEESNCTDNDSDGICADQDCDDNNASIPTTPGSSCDDGNANTSNDLIQADGCTCSGTPDDLNCPMTLNNATFMGTHGTSNYFLSDSKDTWLNAQQFAANSGGYLASISDATENEFIRAFIDQSNQIVLIGYNDANNDNQYTWDSEEEVLFNNVPSGTTGGAFTNMNFWNGEWSYDGIFTERKFVIEIPCAANVNSSTQSNESENAEADRSAFGKSINIQNVFPNPATDEVFVKLSSPIKQTIQLKLHDQFGTLIQTEEHSLEEGNKIIRLVTRDLFAGMYVISIISEKAPTRTKRFIKIRL